MPISIPELIKSEVRYDWDFPRNKKKIQSEWGVIDNDVGMKFHVPIIKIIM